MIDLAPHPPILFETNETTQGGGGAWFIMKNKLCFSEGGGLQANMVVAWNPVGIPQGQLDPACLDSKNASDPLLHPSWDFFGGKKIEMYGTSLDQLSGQKLQKGWFWMIGWAP